MMGGPFIHIRCRLLDDANAEISEWKRAPMTHDNHTSWSWLTILNSNPLENFSHSLPYWSFKEIRRGLKMKKTTLSKNFPTGINISLMFLDKGFRNVII